MGRRERCGRKPTHRTYVHTRAVVAQLLRLHEQYLSDLESPHPWEGGSKPKLVPALRWLLGKAVACDYEDAGGLAVGGRGID